jgi:hypothetical protein
MDINSGVIGSILTTIITLLLLSNQNELQEKQLKNSVIYEEKLKIFTDFLSTLNRALEDGNLTSTEMKNIIFNYSLVRMHISNESSIKIEESISTINSSFFFVNEHYVPRFENYVKLYTDICNVLRKELYSEDANNKLSDFVFKNFNEIAFKQRSYQLPINSIDDAIGYYNKNLKVYYEDKTDKVKVQFQLDKTNLVNLKKTYELLSLILIDFKSYILNEKLILLQYEINNEEFLGLFNLQYFYKDKLILTLGISQKNRIFLKIGTNIFQFEINHDMNAYRDNISNAINNILKN